MLGETRVDTFARRQILQGDVGLTERGPMLVAPCRVESLSVFLQAERLAALARYGPETVRGVDASDAVDGRHFKAGLARIRVELDRAGPDHGAVRDLLSRGEIALQAGVLHELDVAEIGETFAADRIGGRIDPHFDIESGQILNRVAVLAAGQSPDGDAARVAGMGF